MALSDIEANEKPADESWQCLAKLQESVICCDVNIKAILHPNGAILQYHAPALIAKKAKHINEDKNTAFRNYNSSRRFHRVLCK